MGWHHLWATRLTQSQVRWQSINYYTGYYYFECKKVNSRKKVKIYFYKKWSVAELRMAGAKKLSSCSLHPIFPLHFVSRYFHFIHSFTTPTLLIPFGPHVCFSLTSHVSSNSFFTALFFFVTFRRLKLSNLTGEVISLKGDSLKLVLVNKVKQNS